MLSAEKRPGEGWRVGVAIPAAGLGSRMGGVSKPFLELRGAPLLSWALRPFLEHQAVTAVVVSLREEDLRSPPDWLAGLDPRIRLVLGGKTRGDSVRAALGALPEDVTVVAVHDAARPLVTGDILDRCLAAVGPTRGAVAGWPAVDTLKEIDPEGRVVGTPRRDRIWHAQTPQVFPVTLLLGAYQRAREAGSAATDDAALVEEIGGEVFMVPGSPWNVKVTRPEDLKLAELLLEAGGVGWNPGS
jgi:2-C-methyl-D-erythritol 4-phosphate cytidylyltransferase